MTDLGFSLEWLVEQLHPLRPGFWLLLSFGSGAATLAVTRYLPRRVAVSVPIARWVLIPYLGLLAGGLSPRLMGLSDIDWVAGLGLGVGLIFALWLLLALIRMTLYRSERAPTGDLPAEQTGWEQLIWAGALEFHWVFLRGAVWEMLLALPQPPESPGYWAIWLASALALPGIFVHQRQPARRVIGGLLLITTAILFFYTRNFYLCWLLHASAELLIGHRERQETEPERGPQSGWQTGPS